MDGDYDYEKYTAIRESTNDEEDLLDIDHVNYLDNYLQNSTIPGFTTFGFDFEHQNQSTSKISMVDENQTTENFLKEFHSFYSEMMGKVNGLKDTPALQNLEFTEELDVDEEKLFKNLKHTPEVQEQLSNIKKLDDGISTMISEYKLEKEERLKTQFEMCNEIAASNKLVGKDDELFLNLCQFEFLDTDDEKDKIAGVCNEKRHVKEVCKPNDFIMRNIRLAKAGMLGNSSLTDEEKFKLEVLLKNDDLDCPQNSNEPSFFTTTLNKLKNAYMFSEDEEKRLKDINFELEKFTLDEKNNEKDIDTNKEPNLIDKIEQLNNFLLKERLQSLDAQLSTLHQEEEKRQLDFKEKASYLQLGKDDEFMHLKALLTDESNNEDYKLEGSKINNEEKTDEDFEEMYRNIMSETGNGTDIDNPMESPKNREISIEEEEVIEDATKSTFGEDGSF
ncbi:uncharacterized protein LOC114326432 [Diabrotica virgifera virgifera]|uniref:Uncharacterized protein LOC114326432 n=1 Tax=Diabrotica virgifera virgifera TaxID=50390 RepID=A0A6P7FAW7_DIAVI|nr:uncharacterized protein LOC114326432 [Diabrotica virgifera virgifera]